MTKKKSKKEKPDITPDTEERWEVVQVASHMGLSYQTARNQMLQGIYGASEYDAKTRKLTVLAARVRKRKRRKAS